MRPLRSSRWRPLAVASLAVALSACSPPTGSADPTPQRPPQAGAGQGTSQLPSVLLDDGSAITVELALTPDEIAQGLMFRPKLAADRGMLFLFSVERVPSFWMRHTLIPLDLLFLDGAGTIVEIVPNAQPCAEEPCPQYIPARAVWAVLEVNAGTAARHGLEVGDTLRFERVPGYPK